MQVQIHKSVMINQAHSPSRVSPPPKSDLHFQESIMKRCASGQDNMIVPALVYTPPLSTNTLPIPANTFLAPVNTVQASVSTAPGSMDKKNPLATPISHSNASRVRMIHTATCHMMNTMKVPYLWCLRKPQLPILKRYSHSLMLIPSIAFPTEILSKDGHLSPKDQPHSAQVLKNIQAVTHPLVQHHEI